MNENGLIFWKNIMQSLNHGDKTKFIQAVKELGGDLDMAKNATIKDMKYQTQLEINEAEN